MKKWLKYILMLCALGGLLLFGCPLYELTGITCPLCGATRAWTAVLRGDLALAFRCHPLFFLIPPGLVVLLLWDGPLKRDRLCMGLLIGAAGALFLMDLLRLGGAIPMPPAVS